MHTDRLLRALQQAAGMIVLSSISQHVPGADLLEVYRLALNNDPTFEVARLSYQAAQEKSPQARAGYLPVVNLTANQNHTGANSGFDGAAPDYRGVNAWTWTLQLTQPVMRPQNLIAYDEAEAMVEAAEAEFAQAQLDMMLRVAQAYFDALVSQESVATAEAQLQAMEEQGIAAKRGYELGTMSITDFHEARSKAELARFQLIAAQNELENKRTELEKLTGRSHNVLAALKPAVVTPRPEPDNVKTWIEQAKDNNPAVRAQLLSLKAAGYTVAKTRAENVWTLDFVASYGASYSSGNVAVPVGYETRTRSNMAGIQFNMPIFTGGLNSSHLREAISNRDKLSARLEEARRKAGAEAKQAYNGIVNGLAQTGALRAAVESGESSVKGNQSGYKLGIRINSDVLNAQQQLFVSRRDLVKARYDTLFQGLRLKAAAGVLTEVDIETINGMLER